MITIPCQQCGHVNESQRIYCHNCGAKLDRSALPQETKQEDSFEKQQRRLKKLTSPKNGFLVGWQHALPKALAWAALAAAVIQSIRPPDGVPPMRKKGELVDAPQIMLAVEDAMGTHVMQRLMVDEPGINAYLGNTLKPKKIDTGILDDSTRFERAFVNLTEGVCRITAQRSFYGYPFYFGSSYKLQIKDGKLQAENVGGTIGRLPLHPQVMRIGEMAFENLWDTLKREKKLMDQLQSVEIHAANPAKGMPANCIILVTKSDSLLRR